MEQAVIFVFGGICYSAIEILWRGYTHWTMSFTGGLCAVMIYIFCANYEKPILKRSFLGAVIITLSELVVGLAVNVFLKLNIWDYSEHMFNFMGQICPLYSALWFLLCIPVIRLFDDFRKGM